MFCLEKAPNDLLISSDEVPWINNQVDKFIGLNKFSCYSKSKVTSQEEIEALKKYADENPQSWKIRFKNKSKLSPWSKNKRSKSTKTINKIVKKYGSHKGIVSFSPSGISSLKAKHLRMTGKMYGTAPKRKNREDTLSRRSSVKSIVEPSKSKRNGNRNIVRSFFSPDSSAISKVRREADFQSSKNDIMKNVSTEHDKSVIDLEEHELLRINIEAKVRQSLTIFRIHIALLITGTMQVLSQKPITKAMISLIGKTIVSRNLWKVRVSRIGLRQLTKPSVRNLREEIKFLLTLQLGK